MERRLGTPVASRALACYGQRMALVPKQVETIDFEQLRQIDREIDDALAKGRWSKELFNVLYEKEIQAFHGNPGNLVFLKELAQPGWLDGIGTCYGRRRLSRPVREVIRRLLAGWEPFFVMPPGGSVTWNDNKLDTRHVEAVIQSDAVQITAYLRPGEDHSLESLVNRQGIINDRLHIDFTHGWRLKSESAICVGRSTSIKSGSPPLETVRFAAYDFSITRTSQDPEIWILPLGDKPSLPIYRNLHIEEASFSSACKYLHSGSIGLKMEGAFSYSLVQSNKESLFLIAERTDNSKSADSLNPDLLALQFALGKALPTNLAYGLRDQNVVAVRRVTQWANGKQGAMTIPLRLVDKGSKQFWFVEFFEKLSTALRETNNNATTAVVHIFLRSLDRLLDMAVQDLLAGITILSYRSGLPGDTTHGARAGSYLASYGVTLPEEVKNRLDAVAHKLATEGAITLGADQRLMNQCLELVNDIRTVLVAMISVTIGYRGPIVGNRFTTESPLWWPAATQSPIIQEWTATSAPEDGTHGTKPGQILVLFERPEHELVARWILNAADIPSENLNLACTYGRRGIIDNIRHLKRQDFSTMIVADCLSNHTPTAISALRSEFAIPTDIERISVCPAIPCMEAWLLADDEVLAAQDLPENIRQRVLGFLPEDLPDARSLAIQIFGPPDLWSKLPLPDIFRAAERSPSLLRFLGSLTEILNLKVDFPAQSVSRAISRSAIAGLIRDLLDKDTIAWRTADDVVYTAEKLANEVEQGTATGRQYAVDLISMMINALSRKARIKGRQ
jgi:hypothetical protein